MRVHPILTIAASLLALTACQSAPVSRTIDGAMLSPAPNDTGIAPDTRFTLTFETPPQIGETGLIRIHDVETGELVDEIDMSVPASPLPNGRFPPKTNQAAIFALGKNSKMEDYQVTRVGGVDFHFFPIIVHGQTATLYPHNNRLAYDRTYRVTLDDGVIEAGDFDGIDEGEDWTFTTRAAPPTASANRVTVAADGSGDFTTVQGAIDFAPPARAEPLEIFIRNGDYEELVMLKDKANITLRGESRDGVTVHYPNNSAFNPPRGFPSTRPAFSLVNVEDVQLSTFTIKNDFIGQAEALLTRGERIVVDRMTLNGSGDALTTYGSLYMVDSELTGDGDTILGYATHYCLRCTIKSRGPFTWTRTPEGQHGNIFVDSQFIYIDEPLPWSVNETNPDGTKASGTLARLPRNGPKSSQANFPFAEMVLIDSVLDGLPEYGWGPVEPEPAFNWSQVRFMETGSTDAGGKAIDMRQRHPIVRQLDPARDKDLIANYRNPTFVFEGWSPSLRAPH